MADERTMYRQVLLAGKDYSPDYEATPTEEPVLDAKGKETGKTKLVYPNKEFKKGDVVWSDVDLVAREPARYAAYGPPRAREKVVVAAKGRRTGTPAGTPGIDVAPVNTAATPTASRGDDKSALGVKAPMFTREELEGQTKAELKDLAEQCKVEVHSNWTKEQIVDALASAGPQPAADDGE